MAGACFGFGPAKDAQGFDWTALAQRPGLLPGPGEKRREAVKGRVAAKRSDVYPLRRLFFRRLEPAGLWAYSEAGEKRREAVKGRAAAKRSDVYPLRRILFCETGSGQRWEGATKGAGPDQGLSWEAEHRPSADGGRAWGGGETGEASCRAAIPPGWDGWLGGPA